MKKYFLAIDIGASSGRHILGCAENGVMTLEEIYRFENGFENKNGSLIWNAEKIFRNVLAGIKKCGELGKIPQSVGIDTWGVDYALLDGDDRLIGDIYAYRANRTAAAIVETHKIIPQTELFKKTGIQSIPFNSIYQLYADKMTGKLKNARSFLMIPDYFHFLLTGKKVNEYTNVSTTGLLNPFTKTWDYEIIDKLQLPRDLFGSISLPRFSLGGFLPEIAKEVGFDAQVVLPATHDTGSAVIAVPTMEETVFLSSGTWSLLGAELDEPVTDLRACEQKLSNEGCFDRKVRLLKNIMGLWMIQCVRKELGNKYSFSEMMNLAKDCDNYSAKINVNAPEFLAPESMITAINESCVKNGYSAPASIGETLFCAYNNLALDYAETVKNLSEITGKSFGTINIVGGGCQNVLLNELTARHTGKKVYAGPVEATAIGNLAAQMMADGVIDGIQSARNMIKRSFDIKEISAR